MQNYNNPLWLLVAKITDEALIAETAVWPILFLIDMLTALKESQFLFLFRTSNYPGDKTIEKDSTACFALSREFRTET